jgi:hypothetical protein
MVPPGKHEVEVTLAGMEPYEGEVQVKRSAETLVDVRFSPKPSRGRAWYYAIGANVLFGLGALTGLMSTWNFLISGPDSTAELDERRLGWAPVLVPGGAGLGASGTF